MSLPANAPQVDVLFIIDNSGSMASKQQSFKAGVPAFIQALSGHVDYHLGVVSTDMDGGNNQAERGGDVVASFSSTWPFNIANSDTTGCTTLDIPHGCLRGPEPSLRVIDARTMGPAHQVTALQRNLSLGTCGSGSERGLEAAAAAITEQGPGGCNAGFLRANARLVLILLSDEDDDSRVTAEAFADQLATLKPPELLRFATITGNLGGTSSNCSNEGRQGCGHAICDNPPPMGSHASCNLGLNNCVEHEYCDGGSCENVDLQFFQFCYWCSFYNASDCCTAIAGTRYEEFARAFEERIVRSAPSRRITGCSNSSTRTSCLMESICHEDLSATLVEIAQTLILGQ
ncbi:MAG: hypothetical protein U1E65_18570 [Myxococcota bacterium]